MILNRFLYDSKATVGTLEIGDRKFFTLELPWNKNKKGESCIPCGAYMIKPHGWEDDTQVKFKKTWELRNVPNRKHILIHIGNYTKDTDGCILVGTGVIIKPDSIMITNSGDAINYIRECVKNGIITIQ